MGACTMQGQNGTGASVTWANAETGNVFNLVDTLTGTTPIAIPTATGTVFSWIKSFVLSVTVAGTTNITNRTIKMSTTTTTGLALWYKAVAVASYAQAASGTRPASSGSNGATPTGYTAMTTSPVQFDNTSVASSGTGPNGSMAVCVAAGDFTYVSGPGASIALPSTIIAYDEA